MNHTKQEKYARMSGIAIFLTSVFTTIHHVFRLGLELLIPFSIIIILPLALLYLYQQKRHQGLLWAYGLVNFLIFIGLGLFDGFLDHTFKAVGLTPITFLEGSDAEVVDTVFSLWSPNAGHIFYELTGIMVFVIGTIAIFYTYKLIRMQFTSSNQMLESASA